MLSVFIVLLTLFIFITSKADLSAERAKNVIKSLNRSFATAGQSHIGTLGIKGTENSYTTLRNEFFRAMSMALAPIASSSSNHPLPQDNRMKMQFDIKDIFVADSAEIKPTSAMILAAASAEAERWQGKLDIRIELTVPGADLESKLARKRVMALNQLLKLSNKWFSPGIDTGLIEKAEITFLVSESKVGK